MNQPNYLSPPTLTSLRRLLPRRAVSYDEALVIAELQANRLAQAWGNRSIQEADILTLTRLDIVRTDFTSATNVQDIHSGLSRYHAGRWVIWLDASESEARQRFTVCHELKHILDSPHQSTYRTLSDQQIERVCDHFAGCLLMSKRSVYRLWGDGLRTPEALASACRVSLAAMKVRLQIMGLPINSGARQAFSCRTSYRSKSFRSPVPTTKELLV